MCLHSLKKVGYILGNSLSFFLFVFSCHFKEIPVPITGLVDKINLISQARFLIS